MGLNFFGTRSSWDYPNKAINDLPESPKPDYLCRGIRYYRGVKYQAVLLHYLKCSNLGGYKILVLDKQAFDPRLSFYNFDPHFSESKEIIARFHPDEWKLATEFVDLLEEKEKGKREQNGHTT